MHVKNKGLVSRIYKDLKQIIKIIIILTGKCANYMNRQFKEEKTTNKKTKICHPAPPVFPTFQVGSLPTEPPGKSYAPLH